MSNAAHIEESAPGYETRRQQPVMLVRTGKRAVPCLTCGQPPTKEVRFWEFWGLAETIKSESGSYSTACIGPFCTDCVDVIHFETRPIAEDKTA